MAEENKEITGFLRGIGNLVSRVQDAFKRRPKVAEQKDSKAQQMIEDIKKGIKSASKVIGDSSQEEIQEIVESRGPDSLTKFGYEILQEFEKQPEKVNATTLAQFEKEKTH